MVAEGGDGEGDVDDGAVFAEATGFVVVDAEALADAFFEDGLVISGFWRSEEGDGLADGFGSGIAKGGFGACVPGLDEAVEVQGHDGVL